MPTGRAMPVRGISREKTWFTVVRKKSVYLNRDSIPRLSTTARASTSLSRPLPHKGSSRPAVKFTTMDASMSRMYTGSPKA